MSVRDNYLVFPNKKYKIYDLTCNGEPQFTCTFVDLLRAFFPRRPTQIRGPSTAKIVLPQVNPVSLSGRLDAETGFVQFLPLQGPSVAVSAFGTALNFFSSGFAELDFLLEWSGSPSIKCVRFYLWNASWGQIRLNLDSQGNLTRYPGNKGSARIPHGAGFFYVRVASTSADFTFELKVTAVAPREEKSLPVGNGCLCINGRQVPLYRTKIINNIAQIIPLPQWKYIATLVEKFINEVSALNIPLAPLGPGLKASFEGRFSVRTSVAEIAQTFIGGALNTRETSYRADNLFFYDGDVEGSPVPIACQDRSLLTEVGVSIQGVFFNSQTGEYATTSVKLAKLTITFPAVPKVLKGTSMTVACARREQSLVWPIYPIAKTTDGPTGLFQTYDVGTEDSYTFDVYIPNAQEVNATFSFNQTLPTDVLLPFTTVLSYTP